MRASKRIKLADQEFADTKADKVETQEVAAKKDEELFVIDTTAVLDSKKQLEKKEKKAKDPRRNPSLKEKAQIEKLVQRHAANNLQQLVTTGNSASKRATRKGSVQPTFDLWGDEPKIEDETVSNTKKRKSSDTAVGSTLPAGLKPASHIKIVSRPAMPPSSKLKAVAVEVAKAGQSYNPDKVLHAKILHEAIQVEEKRQFAEKEAKAPVATGMSAETRAFLVGSDSEDSDDETEKDSETKEGDGDSPMEKIQKKLTRAQRNKQKRVRAEQQEIENRKRQKKLENSVAEAKAITKQLSRKEQEQAKQREEAEKLKAAKERTKGESVYLRLADENPIHAPTYPVALTSELKQTGGSLRTIRPKGSLLTDRMVSLTDRDMAAKKQTKKRIRVEGKRRKLKVKVRGKGHAESKEGGILG